MIGNCIEHVTARFIDEARYVHNRAYFEYPILDDADEERKREVLEILRNIIKSMEFNLNKYKEGEITEQELKRIRESYNNEYRKLLLKSPFLKKHNILNN